MSWPWGIVLSNPAEPPWGVLDCLSPPVAPLSSCGDVAIHFPIFSTLGQPRKKSMACIDWKEMSAARCVVDSTHTMA